MSHSVIIIDRDGNSYEYHPPHGPGGGEGGNREAGAETVCVLFGVRKDVVKNLQKSFKKAPAGPPPPELVARLREIFE